MINNLGVLTRDKVISLGLSAVSFWPQKAKKACPILAGTPHLSGWCLHQPRITRNWCPHQHL